MKENAHSSQYLLMNKDVCTALFRNRSIIPRTGKEKSLENGARKV